MQIELERMELQELKTLSKQVDQAIADYESRKRHEARLAVEKVAAEYGLSVNEIVDEKGNSKKKSKTPPKFRNPDHPEQTWSGRGRRPDWFKEALGNGKTEADLKI